MRPSCWNCWRRFGKPAPIRIVMVEQKLDYSHWVKDGYGTGDAVIVADGTLHVVDFKYGTGVLVSAEGNSQMRLYALGALDMFGELYDIDTVVTTIYQPRLVQHQYGHDFQDRLAGLGREHALRPLAESSLQGRRRPERRKLVPILQAAHTPAGNGRKPTLRMAQHDFKLPPTLSDEEIAVILDKLDDLISWAA